MAAKRLSRDEIQLGRNDHGRPVADQGSAVEVRDTEVGFLIEDQVRERLAGIEQTLMMAAKER